ncbi:Enoyl-CoA hydratase/isomerase [mine drainage metagenome]|uniref:Enoyl-CoA hydratase/isomerase n=1 Tax=mine drainage metagenome TaxID=410659 RepID=T0ZHB7_9ZZZZ
MMKDWETSMDAKVWMDKYAHPLLELISNYPKPIISAVNGIAFGGGCELNILFDIVIAANDSIFSLPEGLIGALPPIGSSYGVALIGRQIGRYLLTGEWISAEDARRIGIVDVVVPSDQMQAAIVEFTGKLSNIAPLSAAAIKSSMNSVRRTFASNAIAAGNELLILASSEDFKHGQESFLRKRKPVWKGR